MSSARVDVSDDMRGNLEAVRRRQEEADRRERERREEAARRRREEAARRKREKERKAALSELDSVIAKIDSVDQSRRDAIRASDKAAKRLVDYVAPEIPEELEVVQPGNNASTEEISQSTRQLRNELATYKEEISSFVAAVAAATKVAEELARRREAMASAYRNIQSLQQQSRYVAEVIGDLEEVSVQVPAAPPEPIESVNPDDLEIVEASLADWNAYCSELAALLKSASNRNEVAKSLIASSGTTVTAESADDAWDDFAREESLKQCAELTSALDQAIKDSSVPIPASYIYLIKEAIESDLPGLEPLQVTKIIGRIAAGITDQQKADDMIKDIPEFMETTPGHVRNQWEAHLDNLQRVSQGLAPWNNSLERDHKAIHEEVIRHLKYEEMRAQFVADLGESFTFYGSGTKIIAIHNKVAAGYEITIGEGDNPETTVSRNEMFHWGDRLSQDDIDEVCSDWGEGSSMESEEIDRGSPSTVRRKSPPKAMQMQKKY